MQFEGFSEASDILRSGVYLLVAKGQVIYVGKSRAMLGRINSHRSIWAAKRKGKIGGIADRLGIPGLLFDEVHIQPAPLDQLDRLEREMIDRYRPKYNIQLRATGPIRAPINLSINGIPLGINRPPAAFERRL